MKESKAVYVTRHKIRGDQNIVYQLNTNWEREHRYDHYSDKNNDFACQFDSKKDVCTCRNVYGRDAIYFSKIPKQVYAYHGSRSFTDIGVGSVKALQRRKVKRVYLPETDDRGVGSSDLSGYSNIKRTRPYKGSYYDHKKTSSKCVGGIIEYNTGCVISEKLSPIVNTKSGTTSPKIPQGQKNIEIGSNTVVKKVETVGTQFEIDDKEEKVTPKKEEPKSEAMSTKVSEPIQKYKNSSSFRKLNKKIKDAEKQFSSDSLVQHVHDLEMPSEDKPSRTSMDPMENKLEREYRRMFTAKEKDSKPSCDNPIPEFKSASILRRRFEALRRGLTKKDDLKKSSFIPKSSQSRESSPSRKDASVTSDPPSLEGRSYSDAKKYSPIQANIIEQERPRMNYRNERESMQYATEMDSDCQGVRGMFKLWGKKFNLEEDYYNKKQPTPMSSYNASKKSEIEKRENEEKKPEPETKKEKRFFFFKKKPKVKPKDTYLEPSKKKVENVTAGRCEITDGLNLKMGRPSTSAPVPKEKTSKPSDEGVEITRKRWLRRFLSNTIESARSVNVRWNNTTYATSSSTVFELIDTLYKNREIFMRSHSEVTSVESYYRSNTKNKVNFIQDIEAWMIPKTIPDRPLELPVKIRSKKDIPQKNIELSYFNQKWLVDQPRGVSHKIELVLHSKNLNLKRKISSEYLRIDIPNDFFDDPSSDESKRNQTSDEEVYNVIEYETDTDSKKMKTNIRMEKGDNPQSDIKVIVSVQDSKNLESKIMETVIKRPPTQRDVIIQGSNVNIPKRCDVIGVGIITQNDLRGMRKPILKINVSSSEDSDPPPLINQKKCEFAESYLQEYYKHWTPLGLDLYSCVSDSHLKSCSEKSLSIHNQQGDGSKSCPNICDDYQASSETSSRSTYNQGNDKFDDKKIPKLVNFMKKKEKGNKEKDDSGKRVLPKDSLEVFKKRKIYAQSNKCQWHCAEDKPVSVPSLESRGEQDSRGGGACRNDDCPKIQKPVLTVPTKNKTSKKHVSMPDCEAKANGLKKQLVETPAGGILTFKGSLGCDVCKKTTAAGSKHASIKVKPSLEIPEPPCKVECMKQSNPACLQPGSPSCNIPSEDILYPPPRPRKSVCPGSPPTSKCPKCLSSTTSGPTSPPICLHVSSCHASMPPGQTACRLPQPIPCPTSPCPSLPKKSKPTFPYATQSPVSSGANSPSCPASLLPPCQKSSRPPPPIPCPISPCPSLPKNSKPTYPYATESPVSSGTNSPSCPASLLPPCQKSSRPPPPIPCPISPCPSLPKRSKPTCPYAIESPSNSEGINPLRPSTLPSPSQKPSRQPPPNPCTAPCSSPPKKSKQICPHATGFSPISEATYPPCPAMKPDCRGVIPSCPSMEPQCPPPCPASLPVCQRSSRTKKISNKDLTPKISKKKGLWPHCAVIEKSASNTSCRGCIAPNKIKSKKNKKIECCSPQASRAISASPSMNQMNQYPSPKSSMVCSKTSQYSPPVSPVPMSPVPSAVPMSPVPSAVPIGTGISLTSLQHSPKPPKPKPPPKLSTCHKPPCSKIQTKPSKVDGKKPKSQQAGCHPEFPPPPLMNTHCSNQSSPQTSEGCLSKIMDKIKDNKSECKKNCSMMKTTSRCFPDPAPTKDDCESQCPNKIKVADLGCGENSYKKRISGLFLRKNPSKKKTCAKECSAWESESLEPGIVKLNSREKITINLRQRTPSTDEIRECMDVRVKDEDGRTLYERKDYNTGKNRSSVCGNIYDAKLNRFSTPVMVTNSASENKQDVSNTKSEQSLSNLVEIQFKLRLVHGDKATEINIGKEEDQEEKNEEIQNTQEVYSVKNGERDETTEENSPKDDISIKIVVKNYKPKSGKRKSEREKLAADDYYSKISQKFNTVSTGYSDICAEPTEENENVFSVHRATTNLASSTEKSKTYSTASNERSKIQSAASNERSKIHSAVSNDVDDSIEPVERELSNTKSKTSYTVPSLSTEELVLITEDEGTDIPKINLQAYDTHYEYLRETYSNYFNRAHADTLQMEQETTVAVKSKEKVESKSKENSKLAKKELLKKVFQRAHSKPKSKGRVRQLRDMLKIILTDSSTNDDLTITSNELAKDVTFKSLKPNYFRDTDSMDNYYKTESTVSLLKLKTSILEPNNYPTKENNSDETEDDSGEASPPYRGCMCSKVVEKIKDPSLNISCCCRKKTKQDGEANCDLYEDFNRLESIDAETQKSTVLSKVISDKSTNIPGVVVSKREFTTNNIDKLISPITNKQDYHINNEKHEKGKSTDNIVVKNHESKRTERRSKHYCPNAADILQCYEAKKAVLEIYAEKSYSKHGEHLVAKLPKFLYEKESEIERNYDKIATNSYVSVRTENVFMMSVG